MPYIGKSPLTGNYNKLDSLSGFNGSTTAFNLTANSNAITPVRAETLLVSLNGVIQQPVTDYTVSGSQITFTTAPTSGDSVFIVAFGEKLDIGTPTDATITTAKLATTVFTGATDIGGAIADADLFLMDDGAGGTIRKTAASRLKTYIGGSDPASADGDSLGTASAEWSDLYLADGGIIYFGNDQDVTLTHDPDDGLLLNKALAVGDGTSSLPTLTNVGDLGTGLYFPGAGSIIGVATGGTDRHRFDGDEVYLNDTSAAYLNAGLCINQGAEDNEIFELKSSDVAHGVTDEAETDTYFVARKTSSIEGGILMRSYTEGDQAFIFHATCTNDLSGDTATSNGHFHITCFKKSGTGLAGHSTSSNLFVVENNAATQLILKGNGELHLTNTTIAAIDTEDDAMLIRQLDLVGHKDKEINPAGVIETEWDNFIERNDAKLKDIGVLSSENDFIVVQPWIKLANGAIWQQRAMFETMKKDIKLLSKNELLN